MSYHKQALKALTLAKKAHETAKGLYSKHMSAEASRAIETPIHYRRGRYPLSLFPNLSFPVPPAPEHFYIRKMTRCNLLILKG